MTLLILILVPFLAVVVAALVRTISSDGFGHRPGPRSHYDDQSPTRFA